MHVSREGLWRDYHAFVAISVELRDGRFGSKVGQIGPKWDKSWALSEQISVHF